LMLAQAEWGAGSNDDAVRVMRQALEAVDLPRIWQARLLALLGQVERQVTDFDTADSISRRALTAAEETGDPFATAQALNDLWLIHSVRRDHAPRLTTSTRRSVSWATIPTTRICARSPWTAAPSRCRTSTNGSGQNWLSGKPASSPSEPAARIARHGPSQRCCGTGSASGMTRSPSSVLMLPMRSGRFTTRSCANAGPHC
jgi:hypothetical protein